MTEVTMNTRMMTTRMILWLLKYSRMALITTATSQKNPTGAPASPLDQHTRRRPPRIAGSVGRESRRREVHDEGGGGAVHHGTNVSPAAADELDEAVGDEAGADPVGDGVGERHHRQRQQGREPFVEVVERDAAHETGHQVADDDERGSGRLRRDDAGQRREE